MTVGINEFEAFEFDEAIATKLTNDLFQLFLDNRQSVTTS